MKANDVIAIVVFPVNGSFPPELLSSVLPHFVHLPFEKLCFSLDSEITVPQSSHSCQCSLSSDFHTMLLCGHL